MNAFPLYWIITQIQIKTEKKIHSLKQHRGILSGTNEAVTQKVTLCFIWSNILFKLHGVELY